MCARTCIYMYMNRGINSDVEVDDKGSKYPFRLDVWKCVAVYRMNVCAYMYIHLYE